MRNRILVVAATSLLLVGAMPVCRAQDFGWAILLGNGEKFERVALARVTNDSLIVTTSSNYSEWMLVDAISEVRHERRGAVLPATLIGAAGGGALGYALKPVARNQEEANLYSAAFGLVIGGVSGFLLGSILQPDEVHDLRELDKAKKFNIINGLMK